MSLRAFVRRFRSEIDQHIKAVCPNCPTLCDGDREDWVLNDYYLYEWAVKEGVDV